MSSRYLGLADGRRKQATKYIQGLVNLFGHRQVIRVITRMMTERRDPQPSGARALAKKVRLKRALWAISKMESLGFSVKEIAKLAGVSHTTISRLRDSDGKKSVSQAVAAALVGAVHRVAAMRLRELLERVQVQVIDACHAKGAHLTPERRDAAASTARTMVLNGLLLEAAPASTTPHISAFIARVGAEHSGLYVVCAPYDPNAMDTDTAKIEHLLQLEHELDHLHSRTRAERQRLQGRRPRGGNPSSGRYA